VSRHTGGLKGYAYPRAKCPRCGQSISGGRVIDRRGGYWLNLRPHKVPGTHPGRPWCLRRGDRCEAEMIR